MRLFAVELNRFRSRRAVVLLVLAGAALAVVLAGVTAYDTRPLTQQDRSEAAAQAALESQRPALRKEVNACEKEPDVYLGPSATASDCSEMLVPSAESYYPRQALSLGSVLNQNGLHLALVVVGLMVIAGSTFAGADWTSGSLTNQLLFEPRRMKLWLAKAGAVALSGGLVALVVLGGFWLGLGLVADARGTGASSTEIAHVSWHLVRAVVLAMGASLGAFALTMLFRHTVATLALLFVYSIGGEIVVNLLPFEGSGRWSVGNNVFGWLATRHTYFDASIDCVPGDRCSATQTMTHLEAGSYLGIVLVLAVALSLFLFNRRDV